MVGASYALRLAGMSAVVGGGLWLVALEMQTAVLGLALCSAGVVGMALGSAPARRTDRLGLGLVLLAMLAWLLAWLCRDSPLLLTTTTLRTESGQVIAVLRHTLGEVARRELTILPVAVLGAGLLLTGWGRGLHRSVRALLPTLAWLHLALGVALAWEYYLDALTPPSLYAALKLALGLGWVALGYLLVTHPYRAPLAAQQAASRP